MKGLTDSHMKALTRYVRRDVMQTTSHHSGTPLGSQHDHRVRLFLGTDPCGPAELGTWGSKECDGKVMIET